MTINRRLTTALLAFGLLLPAAAAPAQDDKPQPNWVFNGRGQKTDQVEIVDAAADDALFPISVNNNWGLMNQDGQVIVYPRFEWTDYSFEGFARYVSDGKTGFLRGDPARDDDPKEFFIIASYEYADRFNEGCAVVMSGGKWGMIDKSRKQIIPMRFDGVLRMQDGFAAVEKDGKAGFVNRAGKLKVPLQYKRVRSFHDGYAAVQFQNDTWGYINKAGKVAWHDKSGNVKQLGDFHEGYAKVRGMVKGKLVWGYISKTFRFRIDPAYEDARDFHFGMAAVKTQGKWGFITEAGRWAVKPQFDAVDDYDDLVHSSDFEEGERDRGERSGRDLSTASVYAMVKVGGRWGYINRVAKGRLVPQFKEAQPFFRGLARVSRDDSFAYITETGKVRFDPRVVHKLGFVDLRNAEDFRGEVARDSVSTGIGSSGPIVRNVPGDDELGNTVYEVPPNREQADVPYADEHDYGETLPVEK
ncbi:MAG: WG repeat-containing protein [Phycisphaeraceae bacterium]|nr:WG repeat-containing protein [Phycisphaeraceae bacterium]